MESLSLAFTSGWASGINAYLVVLVLGIADRIGSFTQIPDALGRWDVLIVAAVLFILEFIADKVPYLDSSWDAISTAIRPTVGAVIGVLLAGDASSLDQAVLAVTGGGTALASHLVKASSRLAINSSPEPFSNVIVSLAEDSTVLVVVWFAIQHPRLSAGVAGAFLLLGLLLVAFVARRVRRGWRRWRQRDLLDAR